MEEENRGNRESDDGADNSESLDKAMDDDSHGRYIVPVRHGLMQQIENFISDIPGIEQEQEVILRTDRGIDSGEVSGPIRVMEREIKGLGNIVRIANTNDLAIIRHIKDHKEPEEMKFCTGKIAERKLPMRLVGVEHLFSGDKVVFYFLADSRVDFRELVKDLARRYRTRIEMRQIGVRDEARLLADYEHCGRELCCRTFIRSLEPVTMRMAKMQKTTLDPSKISGHCGRLMCCLRFEDAVYSDLRKEMPQRGTFVATPLFKGEVISHEIIKQEVTIRTTDGTREVVHISEIVETSRKSREHKSNPDENGQVETNE